MSRLGLGFGCAGAGWSLRRSWRCSSCLGWGIDALIHFLNRLLIEEARHEPAGGTPHEQQMDAIKRARVLVGPAIILTTIVLAFGLGVTVFSDLPSLRTFGMVCAVTLMASLVADLVFLPATIMLARQIWPLTSPAVLPVSASKRAELL